MIIKTAVYHFSNLSTRKVNICIVKSVVIVKVSYSIRCFINSLNITYVKRIWLSTFVKWLWRSPRNVLNIQSTPFILHKYCFSCLLLNLLRLRHESLKDVSFIHIVLLFPWLFNNFILMLCLIVWLIKDELHIWIANLLPNITCLHLFILTSCMRFMSKLKIGNLFIPT